MTTKHNQCQRRVVTYKEMWYIHHIPLCQTVTGLMYSMINQHVITRYNNRWYSTDVGCLYATEFSTKFITTLSAGRVVMEGKDCKRVLRRWLYNRCNGRGASISTLHLQNGLRNLRNKSDSTVLKCPSIFTATRISVFSMNEFTD